MEGYMEVIELAGEKGYLLEPHPIDNIKRAEEIVALHPKRLVLLERLVYAQLCWIQRQLRVRDNQEVWVSHKVFGYYFELNGRKSPFEYYPDPDQALIAGLRLALNQV